MKAFTEEQLLDINFRKKIIDEITGDENKTRKYEAYKRYKIYKDKTKQFVKEQLLKQFDESTVQEMEYAICNVSLCRKVVEKLARVYSNGVVRETDDETTTESIQALTKELDFNTEMKKTNRFLKLQRNCALYVKPVKCVVDNQEKFKISLEPLNPYLYDVIEYQNDRRKPMAYILSDFDFNMPRYTTSDAAFAGRTSTQVKQPLKEGDGKDQIIADTPEDAKTKEFIFWSDKYHFTCNDKGQIISGEVIENPIQMKPFVNFAIDQDGQFWAEGGDDLIDGSIMVNSVMTHNQHIATTQGYGQFYMFGNNLPRNIKMGASKAILMEYAEGESKPELGFASASPQIDALRSLVEMYVALLLTTNNLSTSAIAAQLSGGMSAASGIALIIDKSESVEDVNEQRQLFIDNEPIIWEIIRRWHDLFSDYLIDSLKPYTIKQGFDLFLKFNEPTMLLSESEKLQNIKTRKELGLNTMLDLIKMDNPDFTDEQAEEKLRELLEEEMAKQMKEPEPELDQQVDEQLDEIEEDLEYGSEDTEGQ